MRLATAFLLVATLIPTPGSTLLASFGLSDPVFAEIPFDEWIAQGDASHIRWTARVADPALSSHQRLSSRIEIEVDGRELAKRRGKGKFRMLVQLDDDQERTWRSHDEIELEQVQAGFKSSDAVYLQSFFILPGEYRISLLVYDTATSEHSAIRRRLHVAPLKNDPLPTAWSKLPAVEFIHPTKAPDNWYQPNIVGRLNLDSAIQHPAQVELLLNLTPSERFSGSTRVQNRNLGALLPSFKVLSQLDWGRAALNVELLDLVRRRVTFRQNNAKDLDWNRASASIAAENPGIIDVQSLQYRRYDATFFLREVTRRMGRPGVGPPRVLIVLSSPVAFEAGEEMPVLDPPARSDCRIYYIRYQPLPPLSFTQAAARRSMEVGMAPIIGPQMRGGGGYGPQIDQLEPLLKPLEPRLFDVSTPEQFRKALATMLAEISKL